LTVPDLGPVRAVVLDIGETIVDETRIWSDWADWLGVPRLTFIGALGAIIARGGSHLDVFELFRPGLDLRAELRRRADAGHLDDIGPADLYPDVRPSLAALAAAGFRLGVAGNQPARAGPALERLDLPVEVIGISATWGVTKPDPAFFERIATELALAPAEIAYVGDRVDNDIEPAVRAGLRAIWIRRGPWAWVQAGRGVPAAAAAAVDSLVELPALLAARR
jgi:HAD superfamily hydrolase (TIGR01662 family)